MPKQKKKPSTVLFPDLTIDDLDGLPRDVVGYAQLKKLEERILKAKRELSEMLKLIDRAKPEFENWMEQEIAYARQQKQ